MSDAPIVKADEMRELVASERSEDGWFSLGSDGDEFDRRRLTIPMAPREP